jgi:hypothetical protein
MHSKPQDNIQEIILDVMAVLYEHGIDQIHMGAILRLLGVSDSTAAKYDQDRMVLDQAMFALMDWAADLTMPANTTLH